MGGWSQQKQNAAIKSSPRIWCQSGNGKCTCHPKGYWLPEPPSSSDPPPTGSHPEPKTKRLQWPLLPPPPLPESLWANRWFHLRDDHNKTPHPPCQTPKFQKNVLLLRGGAVLDFIRDSWSVVHFFLTKSTWKEAKLSRLLLMNCKTPQNWFTKVKYMKICICQVET